MNIVRYCLGWYTRDTASAYSLQQVAAYAVFKAAYARWRTDWESFSDAQVALGLPVPNAGLIYAGALDGKPYGVGPVLFWTPLYRDRAGIGSMDSYYRVHGHSPADMLEAAQTMARISPAEFWDLYKNL